MNTRRFMLRLIVGLLTFLIGVTTAMVLGGFSPLERRHVRQRARRCAEYTRPAPSIAVPVQLPDAHPLAPRSVFPDFRHGSRLSREPLRAHPQVAEPVLPSFEDWGEAKSAHTVAPSHRSH